MKILVLLLFVFSVQSIYSVPVFAHDKVDQIERRLNALERTDRVHETEFEKLKRRIRSTGPALFLFAAFCALWAQNSGRNAWGWFFLGLFFNVITVLFVLALNKPQKSA